MLTLPTIKTFPELTYAFIPFTVTMQQMQIPADQGMPRLFGWLKERGVAPLGAPFYNYRRIDMSDTLDVEVGVPVDRRGVGDGSVNFAILPAGRYVEMVHTGHFDQLLDATAMLIGWAKERGLAWDVEEGPDGDHFACRLEIYETDPSAEPDPTKWVTTLRFKLRD